MIKIKFRRLVATLERDEWSCEDEDVADFLNWKTATKPSKRMPRMEYDIATYIVELFKESHGAEIIYDSEAGKPRNERVYSPEEKMY